ncbi:hypothetical protein ACFZC5_26670 [Nocardia gamkensis]|uniref:hypothetical protein n=1 Tax=Nocardia gamkensis TaxID=352869 RepID=UPI0036E20109
MDVADRLRNRSVPRVTEHLEGTCRGPIGADGLQALSHGHAELDESGAGVVERAIDDTASSDTTTGRSELKQSVEPARDADQDDSSWRKDPVKVDFWGQLHLLFDEPENGQREFIFTANTTDEHAKKFLGDSRCHFLAAAIHNITGWEIVSFDGRYRLDGPYKGQYLALHSAVRTPEGDLLDIFGRSDLKTTMARCEAVDHRVVEVDRMPGDVVREVDHLRGNPYWWAAENPPEVVAVVSHFAKQVLRDNGYAHLID